MHLTHLSLTNYRAFARLDMDIPRRILLLLGDNAQGKTSLLEAVYYLSTMTSFQTQNDRQLISFHAPAEEIIVGRIVADYLREKKQHRIEVRLIQERQLDSSYRFRKEILHDGIKKNLHDVIGHFNTVIFLPQMTRIIEDGPDERRRYINLVLVQAVNNYSRLLADYNQAISQRNALLKQVFEGRSPRDQIDYWDQILARLGSEIVKARIAAIDEINQLAAAIHAKLTGDKEILRCEYRPAFNPVENDSDQYALPLGLLDERNALSVEEISARFLDALRRIRQDEIVRGVTTLGPHRDEIRFYANGIDLGNFGSRGQIRTAILSLKLSEAAWIHKRTGQWPVILLDEILAELDQNRRADLLKYLAEYEQSIMTSTDIHMYSDAFLNASSIWRVAGGQIFCE